MPVFKTHDSQYRARNGETVTVTGVIDSPDRDHDIEVLPLYRVTFADGLTIEAWPDELNPMPQPRKA